MILRGVSPFLAWGDFHARSCFARSTVPEEKWGTTRSLIFVTSIALTNLKKKKVQFFPSPSLPSVGMESLDIEMENIFPALPKCHIIHISCNILILDIY